MPSPQPSLMAVDTLLQRAERILERLEDLLPQRLCAPDWSASSAFCYRRRGASVWLEPVRHLSTLKPQQLLEVGPQKDRLWANTAQFVAGKPANNVLLTGARGTGKSSLVKACLNEFSGQGLRMIEVEKTDLVDLPFITDLISQRHERFIVFCDDLGFDEGEAGYRVLKSTLDGSLHQCADNLLVYATSNRRHLLVERMSDNLGMLHRDGEIHPGETVEEKNSLSERFGLWLSFYPFTQDEYLHIVSQWLTHYGVHETLMETARQQALIWALERGSRSGRVAYQFAKDFSARGPL